MNATSANKKLNKYKLEQWIKHYTCLVGAIGRDEVFLGMKMVGLGMLMVVIVVPVVGETEVVNRLLSVFEQKTDAKRLFPHCRNMLTLELLHSVLTFSPSHITQDPKALRHKVLSSHLLRSSDRVDASLKSKHEEKEAGLSERPLA
nr:hypothetical protein [Tanacetum cinerariifolium]